MEENLLGHLLKANEPVTQAEVERLLASDADARRQLELLRPALAPLQADNEEWDPPADLFVRTLATVAEHIVRTEPSRERPRSVESICVLPKSIPAVVLPSESLPSPAQRRNWLTSIGLAVAGLALLFPAIVHIRHHQKMLACQDNLRQFHHGLVGYSATNNNHFPQVKDDEQVVAVGQVMVHQGYVAPAVMNCPVSAAANQASPIVLASYAYTLGYRDGQELRGLTLDGQSDLLPILADAPQRQDKETLPVNHRYGQNVLYVGGYVRFCSTPNVGVGNDNIFCNSDGKVGAGLTRWDSVLGRAEDRP